MTASPFQQQYEWETNNHPLVYADGHCSACDSFAQWGWCPKCCPLHYAELP